MQLSLPWRRGQVRPFTSIPRINWSHPLANDLVLYAYDTGVGLIYDLYSGTVFQSQGTTTHRGIQGSAWGPSTYWIGGGNEGAFTPPGLTTKSITPGFSFGTGVILNNAGTSFAPFFADNVNGGSSAPYHNWEIQTGPSGSPLIRAAWNSNGSSEQTTSTYSITQGVYQSGVCCLKGTASSLNYFFYVNGIQAETGSGTWAYTSSGEQTNIACNSGANVQITGQVFWGGLWDRALTAAEVAVLHQDPYCFLWYPEDDLFATVLVGVAGPAPPSAFVFSVLQSTTWRQTDMEAY
jgi:hypothetical protein